MTSFNNALLCRPHSQFEHNLPQGKAIYIQDGMGIPPSLQRYLAEPPYGNDIEELCQPLYRIGITYFLYIKRYRDRSQVEITNNTKWTEIYYAKGYYKLEPFSDGYTLHESGLFLWTALDCQQLFADIRNTFSIYHGITLVEKYDDCNEFFHFGIQEDDYRIINFYLNNIDLLKRFTLYFKDKAANLVKIADKNRIILPGNSNHQSNKLQFCDAKLRQQFMQQTDVNRYYVDEKLSNGYLTKREIECLKWYIQGRTAAEIAKALYISKRTVEAHLDKCKRKMNCVKQGQLGYKFAKQMLGVDLFV